MVSCKNIFFKGLLNNRGKIIVPLGYLIEREYYRFNGYSLI